jgi:hypothetical protein
MVTDDGANVTGQGCSIRGYVVDRYGTEVPGSEVRLMTSGGILCMIPDNPVLSGTNESGRAGYFEFRGVPPGSYALRGSKGAYTGSVVMAVSEGDAYVELTLPEYIYRCSGVTSSVSPASSVDTAVDRSQPAVIAGNASANRTEHVLPDIWHLALGGCVVIAGALTAAAILKKR